MKRCRTCKTSFEPKYNTTQVCCSAGCAIAYAQTKPGKENARKHYQRELKQAKKNIETKPQLTKKAQAAFNAYIRARDKGKPCISCGVYEGAQKFGGTFDCGHYLSTGARPQLRFEPLNAVSQCKRCNRQLSGNAVLYRAGLIHRIGLDKVEWLEEPHETANWTHDELRDIAAKYRRLTRELERGQAVAVG